jgi:DNA-binding LacI/PurR family transcriptional regulator
VPAIRRLSIIEQTAAHLREAVRAGHWQEGLPGVRRLAGELGVSRDTLRRALKLLEADGHLQPQGHGRRRQVISQGRSGQRALRVGVLLHLPLLEQNSEMQRTLAMLQYEIEAAGHIWILADKTHGELGDDLQRIARVVKRARADAWIVIAPSRKVLGWFSAQPVPAITFGGASMEFSIAGAAVDILSPVREAVRHLTKLGHRRIVLIAPPQWRTPAPSRTLQGYLDELKAQGVNPSEYHAPAWDQSATGLHTLLDSLFRVTPPTALLVVEPPRVLATLHFLNQRRLRVPQDVSLMCLGQDPMFAWCHPPLAHLCYDLQLPARRIVKWVAAVARDKQDQKYELFPAAFDPGGSIGAAPQNQ